MLLGNKYQAVSQEVKGSDEPEKSLNLGQFSLIKALKSLPNQFEVLDHLTSIIKRRITNSLDEFYEYIFTPLDVEEVSEQTQYSISEIKPLYEEYCFLQSRIEVDMTGIEGVAFLKKRDYVLFKEANETTDFYKRIKFIDSTNIRSATCLESESSLSLYIRVRCMRTQFDEDCINCLQFKAEYEQFCHDRGEDSVTITKSLMEDVYQLQINSMQELYIKQDTNIIKKGVYKKQIYKIDIERFKCIIVQLLALHSKNTNFYEQHKGNPLSYAWVVHDILAVLLHFIFIIVMALIPIAIPYFYELMRGQYSTADYEYVIKMEDWSIAPWNIIPKLKYLTTPSKVLFFIGTIYFIISLGNLIIYYFRLKFPLGTLRQVTKVNLVTNRMKVKHILKGLVIGIEWVCIFISFGVLITYIFLVLEWNILGAVLNPIAYLAYATSATTLIVFIATKYAYFQQIYATASQGFSQLIYGEITKNVNTLISRIIKPEQPVAIPESNPVMASEIAVDDELITKRCTTVISGLLKKKAKDDGFEIKEIIDILKGNEDSIYSFSNKYGIPLQMLHIFISQATNSPIKIYESIVALISHEPYNTPENISTVLIDLLSKQSSSNIQYVMSKLSILFLNQIEAKTGVAVQCVHKLIFPLLINAISSLKDNNVEDFIVILRSMCKIILDDTYKDLNHQIGIKSSNIDLIKYPPIFYSLEVFQKIIELVKALCKDKKGKKIVIDIPKMQNTILDLLDKTSSPNESLMELLRLVFIENAEKKLCFADLISSLATLFNLPEYAIQLFLKFALKDTSYDRYLIDRISEINIKENSTKLSHSIDRNLIESVMKLYSIFHSGNPSKYLIKQALKMELDIKTAQSLIYLLGEKRFIPWILYDIFDSPIIRLLNSSLKINKEEFKGLISLIIGNVSSNEVKCYVHQYCNQNGIQHANFVYYLLKLYTSTCTEDILYCTHKLYIDDYIWLLLGFPLIEPSRVSEQHLLNLGFTDTYDIMKEFNNTKLENKEGYSILMHKLTKLLKGNATDEAYNKRRCIAFTLLKLYSEQVTSQSITVLYEHYKLKEGKSEEVSIKREEVDAICVILSIKSIIRKESLMICKKAISNLCEVMKYEEEALHSFVKLICESSADKIQEVLTEMFASSNNIQANAISEFGKIVYNEFSILRNIDSVIDYFSNTVLVPKYIIQSSLACYDSVAKLDANDILMLFDYIGINTFQGIPKNLVYVDYQLKERSIEINDFKILFSSIAIGYACNFDSALGILSIPMAFKPVLKAYLSKDIEGTVQVFLNDFSNITKAIGISDELFKIIIGALILFSGNLSNCGKLNEGINSNIANLLGDYFKVNPDIFEILDLIIFNRKKRLLIDPISSIMKHFVSIPGYVIRGIHCLLTAIHSEMDSFAKSLGMKDGKLLEIFNLFNSFSHQRNKIKNLEILMESPAFDYVCNKMGIDVNKLLILIKLSFNVVPYKDVPGVIKSLELEKEVDCDIFKSLMSVTKGYNNLHATSKKFTKYYSTNRDTSIKEIKKYCFPLFQSLNIDPELSLIAIRLRQGDFKIIEEEEIMLSTLLSTPSERKITMGLIGLLTLPIGFKQELEKYPKELPKDLSFEGANHCLCTLLNINPLALRIAAFDSLTYSYIETTLKNKKAISFPKSVLATIIMSLGNVSYRGAWLLIIRSIYKTYKENEKDISFQLSKIPEIPVPVSSVEEIKEDDKNSLQINDTAAANKTSFVKVKNPSISLKNVNIFISDNSDHRNFTENESNKSEIVNNDNEQSFSNALNKLELKFKRISVDSNESEISQKEPPINITINPESNGNQENERFTDKPSQILLNYDYQVDYAISQIDSVYESIKNDSSNSSYSFLNSDFTLENILLNNPEWMLYDYNYLISNQRKNFNFSQSKFTEILGTQSEYQANLITFIFNSTNEYDAITKLYNVRSSYKKSIERKSEDINSKIQVLQMPIQLSWLNKALRNQLNNVWKSFKELFNLIYREDSIVNDADVKYDQICLAHLIMYSHVLSAKYKIMDSHFEVNSASYSMLMHDIELSLCSLEMIGIANGSLDKLLPRSQIIKLISIAMGIMPSNEFEHKGYSSMYPIYSVNQQKVIIKEITRDFTIEELNNMYKYPEDYDVMCEKDQNVRIYCPTEIMEEVKISKQTSAMKLNDAVNMEDSGLSKSQQLNKFLSKETTLIFLLKFAICDPSCFDYILAKHPQIIKSKSSWISYSGLMKLMEMPCLFDENKKGNVKLEMKDTLSDFISLLSSSTKLNVAATKSILNLIHGNYHKSFLEEFSNKFQINIDFLEATFLYKQEYIDVQNKAYILLTALNIGEKVNKLLITNVIDLYHRKKEGVKKLLQYSSKSKKSIDKSRQNQLQVLIDKLNWENIKSNGKHRSLNINIREVIDNKDLTNFFEKLNILALGNNNGLQIEKFNQFVELLIDIMDRNIDCIINDLKQLSSLFDITTEFNYDLIRSLMLLINNERNATIEISKRILAEKSIKDKSTRKVRSIIESPRNKFLRVNPESPKKQSNVLVNKFSCNFTIIAYKLSQIFKDNGVSDESLLSKIEGLTMYIFGWKYKMPLLIRHGLRLMHPYLTEINAVMVNMHLTSDIIQQKKRNTILSDYKEASCIYKNVIFLATLISVQSVNRLSNPVPDDNLKDNSSILQDNLPNADNHALPNEQNNILTTINKTYSQLQSIKDDLIDLHKIYQTLRKFNDVLKKKKYSLIKKANSNWEVYIQSIIVKLVKACKITDPTTLQYTIAILLCMVGDLKLGLCVIRELLKLNRINITNTNFQLIEELTTILTINSSDLEKSFSSESESTIKALSKYIADASYLSPQKLHRSFQEGCLESGRKKKSESFAKINPDFTSYCIIGMQSLRLGVISKPFIVNTIDKIINSIIQGEPDTAYISHMKLILAELKNDKLNIELLINSLIGLFIDGIKEASLHIQSLAMLAHDFTIASLENDVNMQQYQQMCNTFSILYEVHPVITLGVLGILHSNYDMINAMLTPITKVDIALWKKLQSILKETYLHISSEDEEGNQKPIDISQDDIKDISKKIKENSLTIGDLFDLVSQANGNSKAISKTEFRLLLNKLQITVSEHRINEIFTNCKAYQTKDHSQLDSEEFKEAMTYIEEKDVEIGMDLIGLSKVQLIMSMTVLVLILVAFLVFILLGMHAFTPGGIFNSLINSLIPICAGVGVGRRGPSYKEDALKGKIQEYSVLIKSIMGSNRREDNSICT